MSDIQIIKLVMVTTENNNKFYNMIQTSSSEWHAEWGRIGEGTKTTHYTMDKWDKQYKAKIKKGYKDVTSLVSVATNNGNDAELAIKNVSRAIAELVQFLQDAAKQTIKKNYTVAVADVTQKQIDTAQELLNNLIKVSQEDPISLSMEEINKILLEVYTTIPRHMRNTRNHLLSADTGRVYVDDLKKILSKEQDLLDVMAGQVSTQSTNKDSKDNSQIDLDDFGLKFEEADASDIKRIESKTDFKVGSNKVFRVRHNQTAKPYDANLKNDDSSERLYYHGSRTANWWSILNTGLKIRPSNAIHTGSMFGDGIYFANKAQKSIGYTDFRGSYWAKGSANKAYLAIFKVNVGKPWNVIGPNKRYESWMSRLTQQQVQAKGFDSVFAKGGADLRNDEHIVYEDGRCTIEYLIELHA